ncbi:hypothetical protein [Rhodopirellula bahusiensis]
MPTLLAVAISIACAGVFAYAWFHRREEWISFPTSIEGHWIRFCRGGRDRIRGYTIEKGIKMQDSRPNWRSIL